VSLKQCSPDVLSDTTKDSSRCQWEQSLGFHSECHLATEPRDWRHWYLVGAVKSSAPSAASESTQ